MTESTTAAAEVSIARAFGEKCRFTLPTAALAIALDDQQSERCFVACMDGVYALQIDSGSFERLYAHESYASGICKVPGQHRLVSSSYDGTLIWYDLQRRETTRNVRAHNFWSWQLAGSRDGRWIASATGQYLAGSEAYDPAPESEPSVKVFDATTGDLAHSLEHVPSVQSVTFSNDSRFVAAGNLMGEVRVWDVETGQRVAQWLTDAFTSWGIIKSHCFIGGIFGLRFSPDDDHLLLVGMGPMRDPMAGNGRQLWQRFAWRESTPRLVDQTHDGQSGEGLMEAIAIHPQGDCFVMGGRLRGGNWNAALFSLRDGEKLSEVNSGFRITDTVFSQDGTRLMICGADKQGRPKDGVSEPFGIVELFELSS